MKMLSGVDIVKNSRFQRLLERSYDAIYDIFSKSEIDYCNSKKKTSYQSFAARFAVKESLIKAIDGDILAYNLTEIETIRTSSGKPEIYLHSNKVIERIKTLLDKEDFDISVSISHEKEYSIAQVIIS